MKVIHTLPSGRFYVVGAPAVFTTYFAAEKYRPPEPLAVLHSAPMKRPS